MAKDALDRWTISIESSPRLAAALAARPDAAGDSTDETTDADRLRALLALLGALPHPDRGIVVDWLFAGRKITDAMLRNYRISRRTARAKIEASGIEGLLLAIQRPADAPADPARHIGGADASGAFCEALRAIHGDTTAGEGDKAEGRGTPPG